MKLGELFVDLGVNSGGAFNTLTGFAFKFNQLADLAKNVGDALDSIMGGTPKYAHNLNVFSQATAISRKSLQGMMIAAKENGGSLDDMVAKIQKYEDEINQFKMGEGNLGQRLGKLGITGEDIINSDGRTLIAKILNQANKIQDQSLRESLKRQEGFTTEQANLWQDYLSNMEKYDNDRRALTDEEIKNLDKIDKFQKKIALDRQMALDKLRAKNSDSILQWTNGLNEVFKAFDEFIYGDKSFGDFLRQAPELLFGATEEAKALGKVFGFISDKAKEAFDFVEKTGGFVADWVENGFLSAISNIGLVKKKDETTPKDTRSFTDKLKDNWNKGFWKTKENKSSSLPISEAQRIVYDEFRNAGFSDDSARAFIGNFMHESGLNPFERTGDKGNAFGIAQWQKKIMKKGKLVDEGRAQGLLPLMEGITDEAEALKIQARYAINEVMTNPEFAELRPEKLNKLPYGEQVNRVLNKFENPDDIYKKGGSKSSYEERYSAGRFPLLEDKLAENVSKNINSSIINTVNVTEKDVVSTVSYLMNNTSDNLEALFSS